MGQVMSPWTHASAAVADAFPLEPLSAALPAADRPHRRRSSDWRVGHALVAACFWPRVFACARCMRAESRGSRTVAVATALAFALLPGAWMNLLKGILSEFPYLAFALAALVQHRRLEGRGATRGWALARCARRGGDPYAHRGRRWVGRGPRGPRRRCAGGARGTPCGCAAPRSPLPCPWRRPRCGTCCVPRDARIRTPPSAPACSTACARQSAPWLARLRARQRGLRSAICARLRALLIFWSGPWQPKALFAATIGVLGAAGLAWRALRAEADALYALFYLAILLFFPFPAHMYRLGLPIVPVVLAAAWWGLQEARPALPPRQDRALRHRRGVRSAGGLRARHGLPWPSAPSPRRSRASGAHPARGHRGVLSLLGRDDGGLHRGPGDRGARRHGAHPGDDTAASARDVVSPRLHRAARRAHGYRGSGRPGSGLLRGRGRAAPGRLHLRERDPHARRGHRWRRSPSAGALGRSQRRIRLDAERTQRRSRGGSPQGRCAAGRLKGSAAASPRRCRGHRRRSSWA